jgi:hypothetical protein
MLDLKLLRVLALALPLAAAAHGTAPYPMLPGWGGSVYYGYGGPWIGGACGGYGYGCGLGPDYRTQLRRELRLQELREGSPPATYPADPWSQRDLPPPTPESEIQPAYREASQIRPEFRRPGDRPGQ